MCVKECINYKVKTNIISIDETLEHLSIKAQGKNKTLHYLTGILYQPITLHKNRFTVLHYLLWLPCTTCQTDVNYYHQKLKLRIDERVARKSETLETLETFPNQLQT